MSRRLIVAGLLAAATLAVAACGGTEPDGPSAGTPPPAGGTGDPGAGEVIPGGGLTVEEALASTLELPLAVKGFIVAPEGEPVRLCEALLESYPPQCGGPSLVVEGLDLSLVEGLSQTTEPSLAQVTWSDGVVTLLGKVENGVITASSTSL